MFVFGFFKGSVQHIINTTAFADFGREVTSKRAASTIAGIIDALATLRQAFKLNFAKIRFLTAVDLKI